MIKRMSVSACALLLPLLLNSCGSSAVEVVRAENKHMTKLSRGEAKRFSKSKESRNTSIELTIEKQLNAARAAKGLNKLEHHDGLAMLARKHSLAMMRHYAKTAVARISHDGFSSRFNTISLDYSIKVASENVAMNSKNNGDAERIVRGWLGSSKHHKNIFGKWNKHGVGVAVAPDGLIFATHLFGLKTDSTFD